MRTWIVAAAMLFAAASDAAAVESMMERLRVLYTQMQDRSQCERSLPEARELSSSSPFRALQPEVQSLFLYEVMICAWELEDVQGAVSATRAARDAGAHWADYALLQIGLRFEDDRLAVDAFHQLTESSPQQIEALPGRFAFSVLRAARRIDDSGGAELRVHEALAAANYIPPEGNSDDSLRVGHARLLLERGEVERAKARLSSVVDPREVMSMRVNRAFDALRGDPEFAPRLDVMAAAEANAERARAAAERNPRSLGFVQDYVQALHVLGRLEEALAELDRVIPLAQSLDGSKQFDDVADNLNWLLNEKAYVLYELGRPEEARNAFGESIAAGEGGEWSVSQVINFASMLEAEQRPADALQVLLTVGRASAYGDMWVAATRACAAEQLGDAELLREALAFLEEHESDNVAARTRALLCVNDLDAAADLYIRRLADPHERDGALLALQIYERPGVVQPRRRQLAERLSVVRARPDVQAAVAAVGRIEEAPIHATYWGDF